MKMLVSVHDVTPWLPERIEKAERLLASVGIGEVTYLVVPNFHGREPIAHHAPFREWCHRPRPFHVEWFLHGYFHHALVGGLATTRPPGVRERIVARLLTDCEGEFQTLTTVGINDRLAKGRESVEKCVGRPPVGFVAPAWLFNDEPLPALKRSGFRFTENHTHVWDIPAGVLVPCPAISWSSRTVIRRYGSRIVTRCLARRWGSLPAIRIALHPLDFDSRDLVASIGPAFDILGRDHACASYEDLFDNRLRSSSC
jgi:predicted deacetylase